MSVLCKLNDCSLLRTDKCQDVANHTACPNGYLQWHEWAETKSKTHRQVKCKTCHRFAIWVKKNG